MANKIIGKITSEVEVTMQKLAQTLDEIFNGLNPVKKKWGFVLFTFKFNESGQINYISNASRDDMIRAMKEWIGKHEKAAKTPMEIALEAVNAADNSQNIEHQGE